MKKNSEEEDKGFPKRHHSSVVSDPGLSPLAPPVRSSARENNKASKYAAAVSRNNKQDQGEAPMEIPWRADNERILTSSQQVKNKGADSTNKKATKRSRRTPAATSIQEGNALEHNEEQVTPFQDADMESSEGDAEKISHGRVGAFAIHGVDHREDEDDAISYNVSRTNESVGEPDTPIIESVGGNASSEVPPLITAELVEQGTTAAATTEDVEASVRRRIISEAVKAEVMDDDSGHRRHRYRLYIWIGILLLVVVGVVLGVVFGIQGTDSSPADVVLVTPQPTVTMAPSSEPSFSPVQGLSCEDSIEFLTDGTVLESDFVGTTSSSESVLCGGSQVPLSEAGVNRWFFLEGDGLAHVTTFCATDSQDTFENSFFAVFRGSCGGGLFCDGETQYFFGNPAPSLCSVAVIPTREGVRYTVVAGLLNGRTQGQFTLTTTLKNDSCESVLVGLDFLSINTEAIAIPGSTTFGEVIEDFPGCGPGSITGRTQGIYAHLAGTGDVLTVSSCATGSTFDTQISVFTGSSCDTLQCVAGSNDIGFNNGACAAVQSQVSWLSVPGERYFVFLHSGSEGAVGNFEARAFETPPFDVCEGAEAIMLENGVNGTVNATVNATDSATFTGSTSVATEDYQAEIVGTQCNNVRVESPGVWYTLVGSGVQVNATTCLNSGYDTRLTVYSGSCNNLVCVTANDDTGEPQCPDRSQVSFFAQQGTNYYILVHGAGESGSFTLEVTQS